VAYFWAICQFLEFWSKMDDLLNFVYILGIRENFFTTSYI